MSWYSVGSDYYPLPTGIKTSDKLTPGVYDFLGNKLLRKTDCFDLPDKVYALDDKFIERVIRTWNNNPRNLGILLNGLQGTGKTVLAKRLCNLLNLPVILISTYDPAFVSFVSNITQEVIIFIDEFEKIYDSSNYPDESKPSFTELLMLLDGNYTSSYKRLFLLTSNSQRLPDAAISRPSRIRYIKEFGNLNVETIKAIALDMLVNKEHISNIVEYVPLLSIVTIDLVKEIINEINIHDCSDVEFFADFNAVKANPVGFWYFVTKDGVVRLSDSEQSSIRSFHYYDTGDMCFVDGARYEVNTLNPELHQMVLTLDKNQLMPANKKRKKYTETLVLQYIEEPQRMFDLAF